MAEPSELRSLTAEDVCAWLKDHGAGEEDLEHLRGNYTVLPVTLTFNFF